MKQVFLSNNLFFKSITENVKSSDEAKQHDKAVAQKKSSKFRQPKRSDGNPSVKCVFVISNLQEQHL